MFANKITYWLRHLFRPTSSPKAQDAPSRPVRTSSNQTLGCNRNSVAALDTLWDMCVVLRPGQDTHVATHFVADASIATLQELIVAQLV
jgi:hypothetical protein